MDERAVVREYECFDIGIAVMAVCLAREAPGPPGMMHLVLGVHGGAPPTVDTMRLFAGLVPDGVPWMVTGIGRNNFPLMAATLACGGTSAPVSRTSCTQRADATPHRTHR